MDTLKERCERSPKCTIRAHREGMTMKVPSDHLRSFVDHDGAVILDISRDQFFSLNTVGAYIWKRLNEGNTVEQIAQSLARETGAEVSAILSDIDEFVTDLTTRHLL